MAVEQISADLCSWISREHFQEPVKGAEHTLLTDLNDLYKEKLSLKLALTSSHV